MEDKLRKLKTQRLKERDDNVKKLLEQKFYKATDELRKNESEVFALECYLEQENQMLDKLNRREKEKKEEHFYVKLNQYSMQKKLEKEKEEEKIKKNKIRNVCNYQKWQRDQNEKFIKHVKDIQDLEKQKLKEQWKLDDEKELETQRQKKIMNKQMYVDIEKYNQKEESLRKKKIEFERQKDKELVDSILAKEKALEIIEHEEKEKKIKEFQQNKKYLEFIMHQKKEAEIWMDKIAQAEADREYKKEQEEWKKEDQKRIDLLKDVYKGREQALIYQKKIKEQEKNNVLEERKQIDKEINDYYNKMEEFNKREADRRKNHQNQILYQIKEKEDLRRKELQDIKYEERASKIWEAEYQQKINEQKENHRQRINEIMLKNK